MKMYWTFDEFNEKKACSFRVFFFIRVKLRTGEIRDDTNNHTNG